MRRYAAAALAGILLITTAVLANAAQQITAKALGDHECDDTEIHFVITQVTSEEQAPGSISVTWWNGSTQNVSLEKYTGKTAHYTTMTFLEYEVLSARTEIYGEWDGQFNLSHGPCDPTNSKFKDDTIGEANNSPDDFIDARSDAETPGAK